MCGLHPLLGGGLYALLDHRIVQQHHAKRLSVWFGVIHTVPADRSLRDRATDVKAEALVSISSL